MLITLNIIGLFSCNCSVQLRIIASLFALLMHLYNMLFILLLLVDAVCKLLDFVIIEMEF